MIHLYVSNEMFNSVKFEVSANNYLYKSDAGTVKRFLFEILIEITKQGNAGSNSW